jgi:hypothetical protein
MVYESLILHLLSCSTSAAVVPNITRLPPGAGRATRIDVLALAAFVTASVMTDLVIRSVLLLARNGFLMIVCRVRLVLFRLRMLSTLRLAGLNGVLAFLVGPCAFLAFRSSFGLRVLFVGAHVHFLQCLHLTAIAAYLSWAVVPTFRSRLRVTLIGVRKCVLILGRPVADSLSRTTAICWADLAAG